MDLMRKEILTWLYNMKTIPLHFAIVKQLVNYNMMINYHCDKQIPFLLERV